MSEPWRATDYILPVVQSMLASRAAKGSRLLDMGCGDGQPASVLAGWGYQLTGFDLDAAKIAQAKAAYPKLDLRVLSLYDPAVTRLADPSFDVVMSLEVIEHVTDPAGLLNQAARVLKPGGLLLLSTPYHGYCKNLALAVLNRWDSHHNVFDPGGHIKYFSVKTLSTLMQNAGFRDLRWGFGGRFPGFYKSMIVSAVR